jgi:hypothetical protein
MTTLVLGCGLKKPEGSIGIDINPETTADILYDLNRTPYPLKGNQFERILCHDILEHLDPGSRGNGRGQGFFAPTGL